VRHEANSLDYWRGLSSAQRERVHRALLRAFNRTRTYEGRSAFHYAMALLRAYGHLTLRAKHRARSAPTKGER
jgi:hypothetical protein